MSRKLLIILSAVAVLAACSSSEEPVPVNTGKGKRFVPQVLDVQGDVGFSPSIGLTADGVPVISYMGLPDRPSEGEIPESRTIEFPLTPALLVATQEAGAWSFSAVEEQDADLMVGEEGEEEPAPNLSAQSATSEDGTTHVVWVDSKGLNYASGTGGQFGEAVAVAKGTDIFGPSVAVDEDGVPWVAYFTPEVVNVATAEDDDWISIPVDKVSPCGKSCANSRTAIAVTEDGPMVAYADRFPTTVSIEEPLSEAGDFAWGADVIEKTPGGLGMGMTVDREGRPIVSYLGSDGAVTAATYDGRWTSKQVAAGEPSPSAWWTTDVAVDAAGAAWVTWYDPAADLVRLASDDGTGYVAVDTPGTQGGAMPSVAAGDDVTWIAWYDHPSQSLMAGAYAAQEVHVAVRAPEEVVVGGAPPADGGEPAAPPAETAAPSPEAPPAEGGEAPPTEGEGGGGKTVTLTIAAPVGAVASGFDKTTLEAPAGANIVIEFDNQDTGVPHDVDVQSTDGASVISDNEIITGPATATYEIGPLDAGDYPFLCSVHPTTMTGTLEVK